MAKRDIKAFAKEIGIPNLIHFTRMTNLKSIIQHGLYPIARTQGTRLKPEINDELRLDGHKDATSLSIAFPNDKMFFRYRKENPETNWVVLGLDPAILWEKTSAFCRHNAADSRISCQDPGTLREIESFKAMYDEIEGIRTRSAQRLRKYDPTDVQAEVLVFDVIEPSYIHAVQFETSALKDRYATILGERDTLVSKHGYFSGRGYSRR